MNPHYDAVRADSAAWTLPFYAQFPERKRAHFKDSRFELLAAYGAPNTDAEGLRIVCDLMNLISVLDETTDDQDFQTATKLGRGFEDALTGGAGDGSVVARMAREYVSPSPLENFPFSSAV